MRYGTHINKSCHRGQGRTARDKYEWVMAHIRMSHGTNMKKSWHICEWVMAHLWMSHVTHMNESCHRGKGRTARDTYEWVMAHVRMSHGTHVNESWHTCERVMAHIWMTRGTYMNESRHAYEWVMSHRGKGCTDHDTPLHFYDWLMRVQVMCCLLHTWRSHGTHANESWHTYMHDSCMCK